MVSIETLSDLRTLTVPATDGEVIYLACHSIKNDGGEGLWIWDDSSVLNDNAGVVVKPTSVGSTLPGRWLRQFDGLNLDPRWFGARAGNSGFDSAPAIQAAIDCEGFSTGTGTDLFAKYAVRFSRGDYYIGSTLIRRRGTVIRGAPSWDFKSGTTIHLMDGANCTMLVDQAGYFNFASLENLVFKGNWANQTEEHTAVVIYGAFVGSRIKNVAIGSVRGRALELTSGADTLLENLWIADIYSSETGSIIIGVPEGSPQASGNVSITSLYAERPYRLVDGVPAGKGTALLLNNVCELNINILHLEDTLVGVHFRNCRVINVTGTQAVRCGVADNDDSAVFYIERGSDSSFVNIEGAESTDCVPGTFWVKNSLDDGFNVLANIPGAGAVPWFEGYKWRDPFNVGVQRGYGVQDAMGDFGIWSHRPAIYMGDGINRTNNQLKLDFDPQQGILEMTCNSFGFNGMPIRLISQFDAQSSALHLNYPVCIGYDAVTMGPAGVGVPHWNHALYRRGETLMYKHTPEGEMTLSMGKTGSGAPTASASFLFQRYIDTVGRSEYVAVNTGTGASDWKKTTP